MRIRLLLLLVMGPPLAACGNRDPEPPQTPHQGIHTGLTQLREGRFEAGLAALAAASSAPGAGVSPGHVPAWHGGAVASLLQGGQLAAADSLLALTGPIERRPPEQVYLSAQLALLRGDRATALDFYDRVQGEPELMSTAVFERAMLLSAMERHEEAVEELEGLLLWRQDVEGVHPLLASSLLALGRAEEARRAAAQVAQPGTRALLEAHADLIAGDATAALSGVETAKAAGEEGPLVPYLEGRALLELGRAQEALALLAPLAERDYKDADLLLADALDAVGRGEQAEKLRSRRERKEDTDEARGLWSEGLDRLRAQDPAAAVEPLRRAAELAPGHAPLLIDLGAALTLSGDHAEAEIAFLRAVAAEPDNAAAYGNLAQLYELMGDPARRDGALEQMRKASAEREANRGVGNDR